MLFFYNLADNIMHTTLLVPITLISSLPHRQMIAHQSSFDASAKWSEDWETDITLAKLNTSNPGTTILQSPNTQANEMATTVGLCASAFKLIAGDDALMVGVHKALLCAKCQSLFPDVSFLRLPLPTIFYPEVVSPHPIKLLCMNYHLYRHPLSILVNFTAL